MTTLTLTARSLSKKTKAVTLPSIPWKLVGILGVALFIMALVAYVVLVNQLTQGTYFIKSGNKQLNALLQQNAQLQAKLAQGALMGSVQENAFLQGFQKTAKVTYIQIMGSAVAQK